MHKEKLEIEFGLPSMKKKIEKLNDEIYAKDQEIKNLERRSKNFERSFWHEGDWWELWFDK